MPNDIYMGYQLLAISETAQVHMAMEDGLY